MDQTEIFQHFSDEVQKLLEEGEAAADIAEMLAAVSLDLALQTAPSPEHAYRAVLGGLKAMTTVRISVNEGDDEVDDVESSEKKDTDYSVPAGATFH
jgi:hypothetical protein